MTTSAAAGPGRESPAPLEGVDCTVARSGIAAVRFTDTDVLTAAGMVVAGFVSGGECAARAVGVGGKTVGATAGGLLG